MLRTVAQNCADSNGVGDSQSCEECRRAFVECGGLEKLLLVTAGISNTSESQDKYSSSILLRNVLTALSALTRPERDIRAVLSTHGYYTRLGVSLSCPNCAVLRWEASQREVLERCTPTAAADEGVNG